MEYDEVALINPNKLANLLEKSRKLGVNLMFLTSGSWDEQLFKIMLKTGLNLTPETQDWIDTSVFLSSSNSERYFPNVHPEVLRTLNKGARLARYESHKQITDMKYVFLDDNPDHLKSLESERVTCIHVKTNIIDATGPKTIDYTTVYDEAYAALEKLCNEEKQNSSHVGQTKRKVIDALKSSASLPLIAWKQYSSLMLQDAPSFVLFAPAILLSTGLLAGVGAISFAANLIWGGLALSKATYLDARADLTINNSSALKVNESTLSMLERMPRTSPKGSETVSLEMSLAPNPSPSKTPSQLEQSDYLYSMNPIG